MNSNNYFTEFTEDDINYYLNDDNNNNFNFDDVKEISYNDDFDTKFRSIQILPANEFNYHNQNNNYLGNSFQLQQQHQPQQHQPQQYFNKDDKSIFIDNLHHSNNNNHSKFDIVIEPAPLSTSSTSTTTSNNNNNNTNNNHNNITVPEKPFFLGPTQFITTLYLAQLVSHINHQLDQFFELSYNFFPDHCRWEIVFLRGSSRSKFEINVYRENSQSFLVEGNRLSGDSASFHNVFQQIESSLTESKRKQRSNRTGTMDCIPLPASEELPMDDVISALKPIISMAMSQQLDTKVEAAKMLCDLSLQLDLQSSLCAAGGIEILMELITIDFGACNQYAMCALANLSSSRSCQEILIKGGNQFLSILFGLVSDGSYQTTEMRRECARTLANLCSSHSQKIINSVGVDSASVWIASVDSIKDERLKLHASRAKMNMEACM